MSVVLSASGCGVMPRCSSLDRTILSIGCTVCGLLGGPASSRISGFATGTKAQCGSYGAPWAIHRLSRSTCSSVSRPILASGGGITESGSVEMIRATSSLASTFSGTMARAPLSSSLVACSATSSRRPACRLPLSGPWQAKQLSERIGRMSRLNEIRPAGLLVDSSAAIRSAAVDDANRHRTPTDKHSLTTARSRFQQPIRHRAFRGLPRRRLGTIAQVADHLEHKRDSGGRSAGRQPDVPTNAHS